MGTGYFDLDGSSIIYAPMYLKNVFYDPLMQALGCTNADLGMMVSAYGLAAMICYLPSGIIADKFRMRTLATAGFLATAVLVFIYATLPSVGVCLALFVAMGVTSILVWAPASSCSSVLRRRRVCIQDRH